MIRFLLSVWKLDNTLSILVSKGLIKQSGETEQQYINMIIWFWKAYEI
jgi:hypothetical protein